MRDNMRVHAVSALKHVRHAGVVLFENRTHLRHHLVLIAEKTVAQRTVGVVDSVELPRLQFLEVRNRLLRYVELRFAVLAPVEPLVLAT